MAGPAVETVIERLFARRIVPVTGDSVSRGGSEEGELVDAFGIPDGVLGAPIALD